MEPSDELKIQILAYLDGSIDEGGKQELIAALNRNGIDAGDLENFTVVLRKMDAQPIPTLPKDVDARFYAMLRQEEYRLEAGLWRRLSATADRFVQGLFWKRFSMVAASLLFLFVFGFMIHQGSNYRNEIGQLNDQVQDVQKMLVMTLLEKESAVDRLRAVSLTSSLRPDDDAVIHALLTTLDNDPDVNVRLVAIDALVKRGGDPRVRRGLVESIMRQSSPLVQVTLADAMVSLQEKSSAPALQKLLEEKSTNDAVKAKLKRSIEVLM